MAYLRDDEITVIERRSVEFDKHIIAGYFRDGTFIVKLKRVEAVLSFDGPRFSSFRD